MSYALVHTSFSDIYFLLPKGWGSERTEVHPKIWYGMSWVSISKNKQERKFFDIKNIQLFIRKRRYKAENEMRGWPFGEKPLLKNQDDNIHVEKKKKLLKVGNLAGCCLDCGHFYFQMFEKVVKNVWNYIFTLAYKLIDWIIYYTCTSNRQYWKKIIFSLKMKLTFLHLAGCYLNLLELTWSLLWFANKKDLKTSELYVYFFSFYCARICVFILFITIIHKKSIFENMSANCGMKLKD